MDTVVRISRMDIEPDKIQDFFVLTARNSVVSISGMKLNYAHKYK